MPKKPHQLDGTNGYILKIGNGYQTFDVSYNSEGYITQIWNYSKTYDVTYDRKGRISKIGHQSNSCDVYYGKDGRISSIGNMANMRDVIYNNEGYITKVGNGAGYYEVTYKSYCKMDDEQDAQSSLALPHQKESLMYKEPTEEKIPTYQLVQETQPAIVKAPKKNKSSASITTTTQSKTMNSQNMKNSESQSLLKGATKQNSSLVNNHSMWKETKKRQYTATVKRESSTSECISCTII